MICSFNNYSTSLCWYFFIILNAIMADEQYIITETDLEVIQRNCQYYNIMLIENVIKYGFII